MDVTPLQHDDDFVVWPFRRQLVDRFAREDDTLTPSPRLEDTQGIVLARPARPSRRRSEGPLRLAVPLALVAFCTAIAGAAALSNRGVVEQQFGRGIVPAAEAAKAKTTAPPDSAVRRPAPALLLFVPDVVGLDRKHAVARLKLGKFRPRVRLAAGKPGLVFEQKPVAATEVEHAGVVTILVGRPKPVAKPVASPQPTPTVIVTSVVGLPRDRAVVALRSEGLEVRAHTVPSASPAGTVVAQTPRSGDRADAGSYVRINISAG